MFKPSRIFTAFLFLALLMMPTAPARAQTDDTPPPSIYDTAPRPGETLAEPPDEPEEPINYAEVFNIRRLDADITVGTDGVLTVKETLWLYFTEERHGLIRVIPVVYDTGSWRGKMNLRLKVTSATDAEGRPLTYSTSKVGRNLEIKIGDPAVLIKGSQTYFITYTVERGLLFFPDHYEVYWNATGNDWDSVIRRAGATVHLPEASDVGIETACYTGVFGSQISNCSAKITNNTIHFETTAPEAMTIVVGWPTLGTGAAAGKINYPAVAKPSWKKLMVWFVEDNWPVALPVIVLAFMFFAWRSKGKDPQGPAVVVAQYEPPTVGANAKDLMRPAEVGFFLQNKLSADAVSATIIDWAVAGYIHIRQKGEGEEAWKLPPFLVVKRPPAEGALREYEQKLWNVIFKGKQPVDGEIIVDMKSLKHVMSNTVEQMSSLLNEWTVSAGLRDKKVWSARGPYIIIAVLISFASLFLIAFSPLLALMMFISALIIAIFGMVMARVTIKGATVLNHLKGLKLFIKTAEERRLEWKEKEKIFETLLPYAMVFDLVQKWAKNFADVFEKKPPEWFEAKGPWQYNRFWQYQAFNAAVASAITARAPRSSGGRSAGSGGSGLGGGGFSGGGFGGGGGRSW
ncbi:MAG: hypothetical protein HW383_715 [Candidatus Magasanikbacteria bacterium]|nr:hypothetical protein [Candidatus Magasanikbacteria bacterium]